MRALGTAAILLLAPACSGSVVERAARADDAGGACVPPVGAMKAVVRGASYPSEMATDAGNAYWVDPVIGGVVKSPLAGGASVTVTKADLLEGPMPLAVNSTDVFWVNSGGLHRAPIVGGATEVFAFFGSWGLFVDDETAYYTRRVQGLDGGAVGYVLEKMTLASSAVRQLASTKSALSLAVIGSDIFGTTCGENGVWRISATDGIATTLAADTLCAMGLVAANGSLYFEDADQQNRNFLKRIRCVGESAETVATLGGFFEFAIDGNSAYALVQETGGGGSVVRVPLDGGPPVPIATASNPCNGISVSGNSVYWTEGSSGSCGSSVPVLRSAAK